MVTFYIMVDTVSIAPHPALIDYVNNYSLGKLRSIDVCLLFPWFAHHDTSITFFLGDRPIQVSNDNPWKRLTNTSEICLFGPLTRYNGMLTFEGIFSTFVIEFKPNGFNKLFRVPATEICNNPLPAIDVLGNDVRYLYEQLLHVSDLPQMALLADMFLIGYLNRQKPRASNDGITRISNQLLLSQRSNVAQYARQANMSLRNFERRFMEQVGTSPKLFCRLLRFQATINYKIVRPKTSWVEIADICGYFDCMHMTKDFKQFANATPAAVFSGNTWFIEHSSTAIKRQARQDTAFVK